MAEWMKIPANVTKPMSEKNASPLRFISITIGGIFVAEIIAMSVIYFLKPQPYWLETLLDALIMTAIVFPVIYYFSVRTLLLQIAERKRSQSLLSKVLENLPVGVWITDQDGKIVHGNPASQQIWAGARYVDMEQYGEYKGWWLDSGKLIEPGDWAAARAISRGETSLNEEIEIECFDGTHKIILNSSVPFFDEQNAIQGAIIVNEDITQRKRTEEALRQANAYNRSLIEASLDPLVTISIDGKITDVNSATEKATGCSRKELIGTDFLDYFTEPQRARAGYQQVFLDGSVHDYALEIRHKDGHITPVLYNATVYSDESGKVTGVLAAARDITERKRYEKELIESKELIETAFNSVDTLIAYMDRNFNFLRVNEAYAAAGGHQAEFFTGKNHFDLYAHEENQAIFQRVVDTGEPYIVFEKPFEYAEFPERGVTYWDWSLLPVRGAGGVVEGVVLSLIDVTERKQAEIALVNSEEKFRTLVNWTYDWEKWVDPQGNIVYTSPSCERITGYLPEEFISDPSLLVGIIHPDDRESVEDHRQVIHNEKTGLCNIEYRIIARDGTEHWIDHICRPLFGKENRYLGRRVSSRDITERKKDEAQLKRQNQELRALSESEHNQRELAEGLVRSAIAASSSLQLKEVLDAILEQILRTIPFRLADITLLEGNTARVFGYRGSNDDSEVWEAMGRPYPLDDFPLWLKMNSTHLPVFIEDTRDSPDWQVVPGMEWVRSYAAAPLITMDQVIGFINLTSDQPGFFNQEMVKRLSAFAAPAAVAIQNARLYAAESHARQVAEALSAAVQALTQTLDLDRVLDTLLEHISAISQSDTTGIALLEGETRMAARAAVGYERWTNLAQLLSVSVDTTSHPLLGPLISTRKSVLVPDVTTFSDWQVIPGLEAIRNWLVVPLLANDKVIGVVGLGKIEPNYFTQEHVQWAEALVGQAAMAIQNAWLFEQVRAGHERLQSLSRRLVEVQESERRYIARELHDETSQALTALIFGLRFLEQEVNHPENLLVRLAELKQLTDGVLEDLHRLAMDLRPASLDHLGLVAALEQLVKVVSERYNTRIRFKTVGISEEIRLPDDLETTLYRIVQEALTNAVRHAKANNVDVILEQRDRSSIVVVEDDGVGFNTNEIQKSGHLGLLGMQERAQMAGGTLQIESRPGGGTTIVAEVPCVDTYRDR